MSFKEATSPKLKASFTNPIPPQKGSNMKHSIALFLSTFVTTQNLNGDDNLRHTKYKNIEEESVDPKKLRWIVFRLMNQLYDFYRQN